VLQPVTLNWRHERKLLGLCGWGAPIWIWPHSPFPSMELLEPPMLHPAYVRSTDRGYMYDHLTITRTQTGVGRSANYSHETRAS